MIDPNVVCSSQSNRVTTPDVLRVELGDVNVLDNHILDAVGQPDALALDDTFRTRADDRLV